MESLRRTPIFDVYSKYGGKIIDFAGWEMPVEFDGLIEEHEAVRNAAGLFDVSHMGEVEIKGKDAMEYVQNLVTNDVTTLENNQVMYNFMCYEDGGIVDDLLVYKFDNEYFYLVINASNVEKDFDWMLKNKGDFDIKIDNISNDVAEVALQGPRAQEILQKLVDFDLSEVKFFYLKRKVNINGIESMISRTGYTGEDGFEIYMDNKDAARLWDMIMEAGKEFGIKAAGLGCRDTLRFEANLPLYGNELSSTITPLEAGYGFFVKLNKSSFVGKEALQEQKSNGLKRKIVGFEMIDRGIPRHGYEVMKDGKEIGFVTTGYYSPTLKKNIGFAMVEIEHSNMGDEINILIRKKALKARVVSRKFYVKNYKK